MFNIVNKTIYYSFTEKMVNIQLMIFFNNIIVLHTEVPHFQSSI